LIISSLTPASLASLSAFSMAPKSILSADIASLRSCSHHFQFDIMSQY